MTIAMYARVSNQRHGQQTLSIEQQLQRLRARAAALEAEQEGETRGAACVFRDEGYSGATLRRPGLDALRDALRDALHDALRDAVAAAAVDHVLITAPDRLA